MPRNYSGSLLSRWISGLRVINSLVEGVQCLRVSGFWGRNHGFHDAREAPKSS